jgi:RHS repeat-associated protein
MPQLREKPHQGVPSSNPALYLGHEVCNSTTALGLQAALHLDRVQSRSTGKERDAESGNDYFGARYYASSMGRFMSPDPTQLYYADPTNPQSMNLYSYALNNPLRFTDPTGEAYCQWSRNGGKNGGEDRDDTYTGDPTEDQGAASQNDCEKQGGSWIYESGDPQTVQNSSGNTGTIPTPSDSVVVTAQDPGVVGALPLEPPQQIEEVDPSLQLALGVMNFGIPKLCAAGITASFHKFNAGVSASGNGVGATANGHATSHYTPQAKGVDMRSASRAFKAIPFGVNLAPSDPSGNTINSVSADATVKKIGVTAYINVGTYTPNIHDPKNCPD